MESSIKRTKGTFNNLREHLKKDFCMVELNNTQKKHDGIINTDPEAVLVRIFIPKNEMPSIIPRTRRYTDAEMRNYISFSFYDVFSSESSITTEVCVNGNSRYSNLSISEWKSLAYDFNKSDGDYLSIASEIFRSNSDTIDYEDIYILAKKENKKKLTLIKKSVIQSSRADKELDDARLKLQEIMEQARRDLGYEDLLMDALNKRTLMIANEDNYQEALIRSVSDIYSSDMPVSKEKFIINALKYADGPPLPRSLSSTLESKLNNILAHKKAGRS